MVVFSPAFTPVHSFVGGLMLASGVHFLLSQVGTVLGISGFFHESVACLVTPSESGVSALGSNGSSTEIHHAISPEDDAQKQSDKMYAAVSRYFVNGMLAGGAALAAAKLPLESALGTRIFDVRPATNIHLGQGLSRGLFSLEAAHIYVPSAFFGMAIGFGTKLGSGCTSGHFLCGLSRLSPRSIVATCTFFGVAVATHLYAHQTISMPSTEMIRLPSPWAILLLQVPALFYALIVPLITKRRSESKGLAEEERKVLHEQAVQVTSFAVGMHFAFGLALTGMTRPSKVLGFFDFVPDRLKAGFWDPSLAMVAIAGILPSSLGWFLSIKPRVDSSRQQESNRQTRSQRKESIADNGPLYSSAAPKWRVPSRTDINWRLIVGAAFFGIGWGMTGLCPGPALTSFGASVLPSPQDDDALVHMAGNGIFVGAMALGGLVASLV